MECIKPTQFFYSENFKSSLKEDNIEEAIINYSAIDNPVIYGVDAVLEGLNQWRATQNPRMFKYFDVVKSLGATTNINSLVNIDQYLEMFPVIYEGIDLSTSITYKDLIKYSPENEMILNDSSNNTYQPTLIDLLIIKGRSDLAIRKLFEVTTRNGVNEKWLSHIDNNLLCFYHLCMSSRKICSTEHVFVLHLIEYLTHANVSVKLNEEFYEKIIYGFSYILLCSEEIDDRKVSLLSELQGIDKEEVYKDINEVEDEVISNFSV